MLKENGIERGGENEGGMVEMERLKRRENEIIERIEERVEIEEDGREKGEVGEKEVNELEKDF
ncbi:toxic anion resistance protein [Staphylococcus epidermidis]|uniref:toxic anion resistance protein n=1 Tax=Staphylococcus epidermidis TaxID=1282 RepID=UPI0021B4732B|nr:toxic anion resistance protein [Staphylococcus epidermidis]